MTRKVCESVKVAKRNLVKSALADFADFEGCTNEEIRSLERQNSIHLPKCYRDFLSVMGRAAGDFLVGSDFAFPGLSEFRGWADEFLTKCDSDFRLPASAFVFLFHQGYTILYFDCNGTDDPPVFTFTDSEKSPRQVAKSFCEWLLAAVEDDIAADRELSELRQKGRTDK